MEDYILSYHQKLVQAMQSVINEVDWQHWHLMMESNPDNPSSNLDKAVNSLLYQKLQQIFDCPLVSEESLNGIEGMPISDFVWIIDPIDGTLNLLTGSADFGISVALVNTKDLKPIISSVAIPIKNTIFSAVQGSGSFENGKPLVLHAHKNAPNILSIGIPGDAYLFSKSITDKMKLLIEARWVLRQGGAAALDICYTAQKQWKAFWEPNLFLWDFAAAELIATESGCTIYKKERSQEKFRYDLLVVSSEETAPQLLKILFE